MRDLRVTLAVNLEEISDLIHDNGIRIFFLDHLVFVKFRHEMIPERNAVMLTKRCKILNHFIRDAEHTAVLFKDEGIFNKEVIELCTVPHVIHGVRSDKSVFIKGKLHIVYLEVSENIVKNLGFSVINGELFRFTEHFGAVCTKLCFMSVRFTLCLAVCLKRQNILMNLQKIFGRELDIIAVHLIVVFGFHKERSIDVRKELI